MKQLLAYKMRVKLIKRDVKKKKKIPYNYPALQFPQLQNRQHSVWTSKYAVKLQDSN